MTIRTLHELLQLETFEERFRYLKLSGAVGAKTFGSSRMLNQQFYSSKEWRNVRRQVILRDLSCDLAHSDYELGSRVTIHHINPITIDDVYDENWDKLLNPENLITTSYNTHKAIHFGTEDMLPKLLIERKPGDTCLWK